MQPLDCKADDHFITKQLEILYIARTKKKQAVYDFIEQVGLECMSHVKTVACDMNAYFASAFKEKCSHIK